jgi:hypothetical protein
MAEPNFPLTGYSVQLDNGLAVVFEAQYAKPGDDPRYPTGRLPLIMTPVQATQIAQALQQAVEKIYQPPPTP